MFRFYLSSVTLKSSSQVMTALKWRPPLPPAPHHPSLSKNKTKQKRPEITEIIELTLQQQPRQKILLHFGSWGGGGRSPLVQNSETSVDKRK